MPEALAQSTATLTYLLGQEWSMGNGQCPACNGMRPGRWAPHPCCPTTEHEGHYADCILAASLKEQGEAPQFRTAPDFRIKPTTKTAWPRGAWSSGTSK
jgi:hypothetical protein